ncbi:hypothetical protein DER29_3302 [Micromonospora sp. M71_S20]|nr:hypothetical protein DER29_3302 [Micromonospora sp. M71_S20]
MGKVRAGTRTAADGRVRSPCDPRCPGQPLVPSLAFGVGNSTCDSGGRHPDPARRPGVPVSLALGVGSSRAASVRVRPACPVGVIRAAVTFDQRDQVAGADGVSVA